MSEVVIAEQRNLVELSVNQGIREYIDARRVLIDDFVERNYSFKGAFAINRKAFGRDMLKTPANILWTPPYFLLSGVGKLAQKVSNGRFDFGLSKLPSGFKTDVEREVTWRIHEQLLQLPFDDGVYKSEKNALFETILNQSTLQPVFAQSLDIIAELVNDESGQQALEQKLVKYVDSRKAAAELSSVLLSVAAGYAVNKSVSLGALGLGSALASTIAYHSAVSSFALGNTLGAMYYSVIPASATKAGLIMSTGGVAVALGVVASYTGMVTDPLQKSLGWHHKKLNKLIDALEVQLSDNSDETELSYKDGYVARIMDLADLLLQVTTKLK